MTDRFLTGLTLDVNGNQSCPVAVEFGEPERESLGPVGRDTLDRCGERTYVAATPWGV